MTETQKTESQLFEHKQASEEQTNKLDTSENMIMSELSGQLARELVACGTSVIKSLGILKQ